MWEECEYKLQKEGKGKLKTTAQFSYTIKAWLSTGVLPYLWIYSFSYL